MKNISISVPLLFGLVSSGCITTQSDVLDAEKKLKRVIEKNIQFCHREFDTKLAAVLYKHGFSAIKQHRLSKTSNSQDSYDEGEIDPKTKT